MSEKETDRALRKLIRKSLDGEASENRDKLAGVENKVLNRLQKKERQPFGSSFSRFPSPRLVLAGSAIVVLIIGLAGGFFLGNYLGTPYSEAENGVTFMVAYPEADRMAVAGDFSNWQPKQLTKKAGGLWAIRLDLKPGRYEYNFIVDGNRWVPDPRATEYVRSYNQLSSVIYVKQDRGGSQV